MALNLRKVGQWAAAVTVAAVAVAGSVALTRPSDSPRQPTLPSPSVLAPPTSTVAAADPASRDLTIEIADSVWQESWQAREVRNAQGYEDATCEPYILAETSLRRTTSTADLLAAFEESKKYRPPWAIEDTTLLSVDYPGGIRGRLRTEATVTDNRNVPPTTDRRVVEYDMNYEGGRWKLCPSMSPLG
ncbi:MAG: hypothetical protein WAW17_02515 [Rhodococcus sp. (in: high G+C Gram-positive bacteria)]|uniref:hypothetical protein n=1 Tax=Rhodococcus sp. TaxID=1831 RepID=UPI003BB0A1AC